jgi:hypothetical protein
MLALSDKWASTLLSQPESGMGYQIATIVLNDGRRFENSVIDAGYITKVGEDVKIPFSESEIATIIVNRRAFP